MKRKKTIRLTESKLISYAVDIDPRSIYYYVGEISKRKM